MKKLYGFCVKHKIPITTHGGAGGFVGVEDDVLSQVTAICKWKKVLGYEENGEKPFSSLKLNIAHFPAQYEDKGSSKKLEDKQENKRLKSLIKIITSEDEGKSGVFKYPNVYTDFSCRATNYCYYKHLRKVLKDVRGEKEDKKGEKKYEQLKKHILFGSDFAVCLGSVKDEMKSYNQYVEIFSKTKDLNPDEKHAFCCTNPQNFLFH